METRMIRYLTGLILLAASTFALPAIAAPKTLLPAVPYAPAMWEVSDADTKITIFGTIHVLPPNTDWFRPHVVKALDSADRLVLETLPPDSAEMTGLVVRLARLSTPRPVLDRVPEASRPALAAALADLNAPPLAWYDTWYVALVLSNLQTARNGLDPRVGVEAVLSERARIKNKPIEGLETPEEQLIYFDALPERDQTELLLSTLEELPTSKQRTADMVTAWLGGDTAGLADQMNDGFDRSPMLRRMLVDDRNERWAAWIAKRLKDTKGVIFLAVGAGHLAGPGNLVEKLKPYGIEARPVMQQPARKTPVKRARK